MTYRYLVTTQATDIPTESPVVMIDGTVPHWSPTKGDMHFDHHRSGGKEIQIWEIPDGTIVPPASVFVTTQIDADACAAAAWLQLLQLKLDQSQEYEAYAALSAIAYDCDHLGLPLEAKWDGLRDFARNAVAAMKLSGDALAADMGLPKNRKLWTEDQKREHASECFKRCTEALVSAALGQSPYPGQNGEAKAYWDKFESQREMVSKRCSLVKGIAVFDARGIGEYIDPRHLVEWARLQPEHSNTTLTIRDRPLEFCKTGQELILWDSKSHKEGEHSKVLLPGYSYTLGSVPLHDAGSPRFSDRGVWEKLSEREDAKRDLLGFPRPSSRWGGRNEVGCSSWNDAVCMIPEEAIAALNIAG